MERFANLEDYKINNKYKLFKLTSFNKNANIDIIEMKDNCIKAKYKARYGGLYYDTTLFKTGKYKISAYGYNTKILINNIGVSPSKNIFELDFSKTQTFQIKSKIFEITDDMKELQFLIHFFNSDIKAPVDACIKNVRIEKINI